MAVVRSNAVTGEQLILTITFREDDTANLFDPFSVEQVDILAADGQTVLETISSGSITKLSLGRYQLTTVNVVDNASLILDRWMYRLEDGGSIRTSTETTNVAQAPGFIANVESQDALPRNSAVVLRPILLTIEFRDDRTGELFDPAIIRQVDILEENGITIIESIAAITRIGFGRYRIQTSAIQTPKTILDRWFFTAEAGESERFHIQDTQIYDQAALGAAAIEDVSVPETLTADVFATSQEVVLCNRIQNIGILFKDSTGTAVDPAELSLNLTTRAGGAILLDTYLPTVDRDPDPPRMLNPSVGRFEFPFGLDNGSRVKTKTNKTSVPGDFLFNWRATSRASVTAKVTINPGINLDSSLVWSSAAKGTPGNFISVAYIDPATADAALSLVRDGSKITINLATDSGSLITTTASDIVTAVSAIGNEDIIEIITAAFPTGETGLGVVGSVSSINLTSGIDASEELFICQPVKVISHQVCSLLQKFRLQIDKAIKVVNEDPSDPCFLGYTEGQLLTYLEGGLQVINAYQPSGCFNFNTFPYDKFCWTLLEASLLAGVMSQQLFAVDTDIPNWSDQGNSFVIQHQPQLASYLNFLSQRLDKTIPQMKLNFVSSGSLHIEAGPSFRLAQLIDAAPSGSLFRGTFFKS